MNTFDLNNNYNTLFKETNSDINNELYSKIDDKIDNCELDSIDSDEIDTNRFKSDIPNINLTNDYEELCKKRNQDELLYKSEDGYNNYKSSIEDKFGVSNGLNFMVGNNFGGIQESKNVNITDNDIGAYKRLLEHDN